MSELASSPGDGAASRSRPASASEAAGGSELASSSGDGAASRSRPASASEAAGGSELAGDPAGSRPGSPGGSGAAPPDADAPAVPPAPEVARAVFGPGLADAERYVARLATDGVTRGLIGPREVPRLWERHVLNSAAVADAVPPDARVVDVGSGAGLPGIPLALARPDLRITLLEPMARRVEFLEEVVAELGAPWCVLRGRAEERSVRTAVGPVDVVTARAVAALPRLVSWCRGLLRPGAQLVALVGSRALEELPSLVPELEAAGMRDVHARAVGAGLGEAATTVVVMTRGTR